MTDEATTIGERLRLALHHARALLREHAEHRDTSRCHPGLLAITARDLRALVNAAELDTDRREHILIAGDPTGFIRFRRDYNARGSEAVCRGCGASMFETQGRHRAPCSIAEAEAARFEKVTSPR